MQKSGISEAGDCVMPLHACRAHALLLCSCFTPHDSHPGRVQLLLLALWPDTDCSQLFCLSCITLTKHIHLEALAVKRCLRLLVSFDVFDELPAPTAGDNMLDDRCLLIRDLFVRHKQSSRCNTVKTSPAGHKQFGRSKAVKSSQKQFGRPQAVSNVANMSWSPQTPTRIYQAQAVTQYSLLADS